MSGRGEGAAGPAPGGSRRRAEAVRVGLVALFVTALVTAQLLAVKILALPLGGDFPVVGPEIVVPAGVLAYAATFFASDCYAELYGRWSAQVMVNVAFAMNFVLLALVWLAIEAPGSPTGVDPDTFATVFSFSTNVVVGSLAAYLVSQNLDVLAFHAIRERTGERMLWVRNVGSTAASQFLDTAVFVLVTFAVVPAVAGIGSPPPVAVLVQLIVGQYLIKLLIALMDTPAVYAVVGYVRSEESLAPQATS